MSARWASRASARNRPAVVASRRGCLRCALNRSERASEAIRRDQVESVALRLASLALATVGRTSRQTTTATATRPARRLPRPDGPARPRSGTHRRLVAASLLAARLTVLAAASLIPGLVVLLLTAMRPERRSDPELRGTLLAMRAVARRVQQLTAEERELAREIETLARKLAPQLLDQPGVGPLAAAQVLLSWSHRGRLPNGGRLRTPRRLRTHPRLLRPDDPLPPRPKRRPKTQPCLALILVTRKRSHPATIAYIERRLQEGKTRREANRCLKRYLARSLYRLLEHGAPLAT